MTSSTAFNVDLARAQPGSTWQNARRIETAERAAQTPLPSAEEEIWRYSRIADLDPERFTFAAADTNVQGLNGFAGTISEDDPVAPAPDVFADWNAALCEPLVIRVPRRTAAEQIIVVTHTVNDGTAAFPRLVVEAGEDSEVTIVERFRSAPNVTALVVPVLELRANQASRVRYLAINELGRKVWQIGHQLAWAERDSSVTLSTVALGGDYARVRTEAVANGQGSSTRQTALYFADGTQMHDFRTIQSHVAPRSESNLLFKGAVKDTARSVYTGLIRIGHDAKGASAFQTNRSLTLSEGAWAESVPNLDILTNDVRCSHASAVGPVDPEQRFYLESRGVSPDVAERLIVLGFFDEVLMQLPAPELADQLRATVAAKLDGVAA